VITDEELQEYIDTARPGVGGQELVVRVLVTEVRRMREWKKAVVAAAQAVDEGAVMDIDTFTFRVGALYRLIIEEKP
jgi:hypothetical protein